MQRAIKARLFARPAPEAGRYRPVNTGNTAVEGRPIAFSGAAEKPGKRRECGAF